jgi:3-isopropylmalate/(R)-2-methylmalate dehydratase small subunit
MEKFTKIRAVAAPLPITNVDTDMIISQEHLRTIERTGLGKHAFSNIRYNEDGSEKEDFRSK